MGKFIDRVIKFLLILLYPLACLFTVGLLILMVKELINYPHQEDLFSYIVAMIMTVANLAFFMVIGITLFPRLRKRKYGS